jgi:hypothetical protein
VDLDPTNDIPVGESHVTAAWGRDYGDVAPVAGIILGGHDHVVDVGVDVIRWIRRYPSCPTLLRKARRDKQGAFSRLLHDSPIVILIALGAMAGDHDRAACWR